MVESVFARRHATSVGGTITPGHGVTGQRTEVGQSWIKVGQ